LRAVRALGCAQFYAPAGGLDVSLVIDVLSRQHPDLHLGQAPAARLIGLETTHGVRPKRGRPD